MSNLNHNGDGEELGVIPPHHQAERAPKVNAFIGKGVDFKGKLRYDGTIRIDGTIEGEISTEGCLLVGEGAVVTARVRAGTVICRGRIRGDIIAQEKVVLRGSASVTGTLTAPVLSIEEGVRFNGEVTMRQNADLATVEPQSEAASIESEHTLIPLA